MMKSVHALYPGTFDPLTLGHLDIVQRAAALFPRLTLAIAEGGRKTLFDIGERVGLARAAVADIGLEDRVDVIDFSGLLVDCLRETGADLVVRGIRTVADLEHEQGMEAINRRLYPDFEAMTFFARPELSMLSGTLVRDVARCGGDLTGLVPGNVARALEGKA